MAHRLQWTALALKDLEEIRDFIRRDHREAAQKEALRIRRSTEKLMRFPQSGRLVAEVPSIREVISGNYHIYYRLSASRVEILRVYHGKRRPPSFP